MFSTPEDLSVLMRGLLFSNRILSEDARKVFLTPPVLDQCPSFYGLGIVVRDIDGGRERAYGHDGKDLGYRADLHYLEKAGITIALCANRAYDPQVDAAYLRLLERLIELAVERSEGRIEG